MDSCSSPIAIKHAFKVSEEDLKTKLKSEGEIFSNYISISGFPDLQWRIDLNLDIKSDENGEEKEMLGAYLTMSNVKDDMKIFATFTFFIKSSNFLEYYYNIFHKPEDSFSESDESFIEDTDSWGDIICSLNDLFDPEKKYIVGGELIVEMKGIIFVKNAKKKSEKPENSLSQRLWNDEDVTDFLIVTGNENDEEKTELEVHKCVLSVCSPVFKRMFKTDMKEKREGKVEIIDFDRDTVELAVAFCYDQEIFEDYREWEQLITLHQFADKYDIEDLKHHTEAYMVEELSLYTICETTNVIISLNAPKLRDLCFRFLLMAVKEGIPIKDMDVLDNVFARELLKKATSIEYC